jgi:hypothetical protein
MARRPWTTPTHCPPVPRAGVTGFPSSAAPVLSPTDRPVRQCVGPAQRTPLQSSTSEWESSPARRSRSSAWSSFSRLHSARRWPPLPSSTSFPPVVASTASVRSTSPWLSHSSSVLVCSGFSPRTPGRSRQSGLSRRSGTSFECRRRPDVRRRPTDVAAFPRGVFPLRMAAAGRSGDGSFFKEQRRCCGSGRRGTPAPSDRIKGERSCSFAVPENRRFSVPWATR